MEDMCYERRRAETFVDKSAHHALVPSRNFGTRGNTRGNFELQNLKSRLGTLDLPVTRNSSSEPRPEFQVTVTVTVAMICDFVTLCPW